MSEAPRIPYIEYRHVGGTMRVVVNVDTCGPVQEHAFGGAPAYGGQRRLGFYPPLYVHFDGSVSAHPTPPRCEDEPTTALVKQPETGDLLEVSNLSEALHACYPRPAQWQPYRFASPEALAVLVSCDHKRAPYSSGPTGESV